MKVKYSKAIYIGGCTFCDKGQISDLGYGIKYPYEKVFELNNNVKMCVNCYREFRNKVDKMIANELANKLEK